jgi:hypothetical protein
MVKHLERRRLVGVFRCALPQKLTPGRLGGDQVVAEHNHGAGRMCAGLRACSTVGVFDRATCSRSKGCGVDTSLDMKRELSISLGSGIGSRVEKSLN